MNDYSKFKFNPKKLSETFLIWLTKVESKQLVLQLQPNIYTVVKNLNKMQIRPDLKLIFFSVIVHRILHVSYGHSCAGQLMSILYIYFFSNQCFVFIYCFTFPVDISKTYKQNKFSKLFNTFSCQLPVKKSR